MSFRKPQLKYSKHFPAATKLGPSRSLLIYDGILLQNPEARAWIEKFPARYGVASGESLKDIEALPRHLARILEIAQEIPERPLQFICMGGGSVGDFAGFVASVFKRGAELIQIPSTWLAAIDSAHGGKNALNVGNIKNQIGTFHFPAEIHLVAELLMSQPEERAEDALGEALKISLIEGGALWKKWEKLKAWDSKTLWKLLPDLIEAKYKVVRKDPLEKKGLRHALNLGHTVGHVIEAELHLSHGQSVLWGLNFALQWSQELGILKTQKLGKLGWSVDVKSVLKELQEPEKYLKQDKKRVGGGKVRFVFLQKPGKTVIRAMDVSEILDEIQRQAQ